MISFQTYQKIQEHKAYGASMLRTSQMMGLSYNTVYKWWDLTEDDFHASYVIPTYSGRGGHPSRTFKATVTLK